MRPQRLELSGFASFREPCVVDFADAELFAIVGPTGSGKSSLIDAIVFSLYGSVPRYQDARLLYPLITQGKQEARVRFDFAVGDEEYTAVRVVRRTKTGASTKEARLERRRANGDAESVAGDADGLTREVQTLLGLQLEHFQKCVALPQGAFAEFLHAKPKERQDLLVELLDLEIYRQIATRANARAKERELGVQERERQLAEELAGASAEALEQATGRVAALATLEKKILESEPKIAKLRKAAEQASLQREAAEAQVAALRAVSPPADLANLAENRSQVEDLLSRARKARDAADREVEARDEALAGLPKEADLRLLIKAHEDHADAARSLKTVGERLEKANAESTKKEEARAAAEAAEREAQQALESVRRGHQAHDLSQTLVAGEPCPVCLQTIAKVPKHPKPKALETAQRELENARKSLEKANRERDVALSAARTADGEARAAEQAAKKLAAAVKGKPGLAEAKAALEATLQATRALEVARDTQRKAGKELQSAEEAKGLLDKIDGVAWTKFDQQRDSLAALGPPAVADRNDVAGAWRDLIAWAKAELPKASKRVTELGENEKEKDAAVGAEVQRLLGACTKLGIAAQENDYTKAVAAERARAEGTVATLKARIEKASRLRQEIETYKREAAVAKELGRHLGSMRFERWLLERALQRLCRSASHLLRELSSGQYSIRSTADGDFEVLDHHNADEARLARTLSGGETFMASLALALALSEDVAQLAAGGAARLEALFLDEGFGTLDPDTLDTVATAIEALGARGRVVGLITHVRELADRVPVRFQVRKDARTSTVERVAV